jgi:hypothetical protein
MWSKLRKRLTWEHGKIEYIQTWERHRNGGCHTHIVVSNADIYQRCDGEGWKIYRREFFRPQAVACGFGRIIYVRNVHTKGGLASYLLKQANELTDRGKEYQIPVDAPPHFRRIRASKGLLPPCHAGGEYTGKMIFENEDMAKKLCGLDDNADN